MPVVSRMQAEAVLRSTRAGRTVYDDLRPAYTRLDPLVTLLRRRGFSGVMYAAGGEGAGAVWFDRGRLHSGWLLPAGSADIRVEVEDPLQVIRALWADTETAVSVHPGAPPVPAEGTPPVIARRRPPAPSPAAVPVPARPPAAPVPPEPVAADHDLLGTIPWARLLPEALARVRRHRGTPLARQLEEAVNAALAPDAVVEGKEVWGTLAAESAAAALQEVAAGLARVAGAAFTERLLLTLGRDFDCAEALKAAVPASPQAEVTSPW